MKQLICASLILTAAGVPAFADAPTLEDLAFITGSWAGTLGPNIVEETWSEARAGTMMGMFRWIEDGSTRFSEHIMIEQRDDGVHLFLRHFDPGSTIWEQEVDGPMAFRLDTAEDNRAVFVDDDSDFPHHFIFHSPQPDTLIVQLASRPGSDSTRELTVPFRSTTMSTATEQLNEAGQALGYQGGLTISFQTADLAKSLTWYQDVLGFRMLYHMEEMGWCELTTGVANVNVGLSQVESVKPGGPTPTFGVNDIEAARARLEAQGVRFDGPTIEIPGLVRLATFFDPDGNALMFFQTLADGAR